MLERLPVRRHVRRLAALALAAVALAAMPQGPAPTAAQTTGLVDEDLVDLQAQFAQGQFQRTAVNSGIVPGSPPPFADRDGTLQLPPVGFLRSWDVGAPALPQALAAMGVTTLGNRIYTVGGATAATGDAFTNAVYWATINQQTGAPSPHGLTEATKPPGSSITQSMPWSNAPRPWTGPFPPDPPSRGAPHEQIGARRGPAVASFRTGGASDYIYSIGGTFVVQDDLCGTTLTSPAVQVGAVNSTSGDIAWSADPQGATYLPSQDLPAFESWDNPSFVSPPNASFGVEGATASVVTTGGGATYLYVIGGLVTYVDGVSLQTMATPAVFYTRLNPTTGALEDPTPGDGVARVWARADNVPLNLTLTDPSTAPNPGELGIYNHTAIVSQAVVGQGTGTTTSGAIFVTGGFTEVSGPSGDRGVNSFVYRAIVNDDGTLRWETDLFPPYGDETGVQTEGQGRADVAGFAFASKLYVIGGRPGEADGDAPLGTITTAVHNDRLDLLPLFNDGGNPTYFTGGQGPNVLANPVYRHGAAVVPATPPPGATQVQNAAWGYALGGFTANNQPTDTIYIGRIGGTAETESARRIPDGWYYSPFYNIRLDRGTTNETEARIVSVRWFSGVERGANPNADLRVEFRRTKLLPCNAAAFQNSPWVALDGNPDPARFSRNGNSAHEVLLRTVYPTEDFNASCMQFRVYMTQNGSSAQGVPNPPGDATQSPRLFRLAIQKIKPGSPDLRIAGFNIGPDESGRISTFDLRITNLNGNLLNTAAVERGQFPVVLCVAYAPLNQPPPTLNVPTLPITNDPEDDDRVNCAPIYRWVDPSETAPGQIFSLNNNWEVNFANVPHLPPGSVVDEPLPSNPLGEPRAAFAVRGHYAVAALIDPFNLVPEGGLGKANNRGESPGSNEPLIRRFPITEAGFAGKTSLPMVRR